jgi:hypothetical protein
MVVIRNFVVAFIVIKPKVMLQMLTCLNFLGTWSPDEVDLGVIQNFLFFELS